MPNTITIKCDLGDLTMPYGIKAYGSERRFNRKEDYLDYLLKWIDGTEGSEQARAIRAFTNLRAGIYFTDTDTEVC